MDRRRMFVHQALARALADLGRPPVFGVMGDGNLFMVNSYLDECGGTFVGTANEAGAVAAAYGYACRSGSLGVATVTCGPAVTNSLTPLIEAVRAGVPLLLIAGDVDRGESETLQHLSQAEVARSLGAGFVGITEPGSVFASFERAAQLAVGARTAVLLSVPLDLQWMRVHRAAVSLEHGSPPPSHLPGRDQLEQAAALISTARRPLILAGRGAIDPATRQGLLALSERTGAALATTLKAKDLFRGVPADVGLFGISAGERSVAASAAADCLLVVGASLNRWTTDRGALLRERTVIRIDAEAAQGHSAGVDVSLVGDAGAVVGSLLPLLDEIGTPPTSFADRLPSTPHAGTDRAPTTASLTIDSVLEQIDRVTPPRRTLVLDAGRFVHHTFDAVHVPGPSSYVHTINFGSIGLGIGAALGAQKAAPGEPALVVCGDGGFMLGGLAEFNTAVRHGIDLIVVVLNDRAYGAEYVQFTNRGMSPRHSRIDWPGLAPVAEALGGRGMTIARPVDLAEIPQAIAERDRPLLIDVELDPDRIT